MAAVLDRSLERLSLAGPSRSSRYLQWSALIPILAVANAIAFLLIQPGVNDLWAARARANAAKHGVGLTYWFSWFGGGSTPGNYSVLTPYLSALITPELLGALAAVAITPLAAVLLRTTRYPLAGVAVASAVAGVNLWSGRVPFILGGAFGIAALIAVTSQRRVSAVVLTLLSVFASPVSGAFLALGLAGAFIENKSSRAITGITVVAVAVGLGAAGLAFGTPGPEPFSFWLFVETVLGLALFLVARPPTYLRTVIYLSMFAALALVVIPNGMGSNFARMAWFCLPVAVLATSTRRLRVALLTTIPVVLLGAQSTVTDLRDASEPVSQTSYYKPLAAELDRLHGLANFRVEIVTHGAHVAYDALLDHAMLARGWETQEDNALNKTLANPQLDGTSYKIWLDNNSVGYVAIPITKKDKSPEYALVDAGKLPYLSKVWSSTDWVLFRVANPTSIVAPPQNVLEYSQSHLTIRVPCACTFNVRVRYSKFLRATTKAPGQAPARVTNDGYGYTSVTTPASGDYVLQGTVTKIFH